MNDAQPCPSRDDDETARRWTAGSLAPDSATAFETHLLACGRCQEAVQRAATMAAALRTAAGSPSASPRGIRWVRWLAPIGIAAGLVAIAAWPRDRLSALSDPGLAPAFTPAQVRSLGDTTSDIDQGMSAYQAGNYREAARKLGAVASDRRTSAVQFFLGASRLLAGDARGAVDALASAAGDAASPYAAEAQLWRAKAWLRLGEADSASIVLRALAGRADVPAFAAHAGALADSVEEVRRR